MNGMPFANMLHRVGRRWLGPVLTPLLVLLLALCWFLPASALAGPSLHGQRGTIGTASVGGSFYMWAAGWAKLLEEQTGYSLAVEATPGAFHNIRLLEQGDLNFALAFFPAVHDVLSGERGPKGVKLEKSRLMFAYAPYYMVVLTPQSSGILNYRQLQGKKINVLPRGGGSDTYNKAMFALLGIKPEHIVNSSAADAITSLNDGMVDAVAGIGAHPWGPALEAEVNQPMHIVAYDPADLDAVLPKLPGWFKATRPAGGYKSTGGEQDTLGYLNIMLASVDVPEDTVYAMTRAFFENKEYFMEIDVHTLTARMEDVLDSPIRLHRGAVRYLEEQGVSIPAPLKE